MADALAFVDTNVFVYTVDVDEPVKRPRAIELLASSPAGSLVTSAQVLGEFFAVVTRKLSTPRSTKQARTDVAQLAPLARVAIDRQLVVEAIDLCAEQPISYWDALILRAAATAGCTRLLTEDLAHGQSICGVRVEDPFRS